MTRPSGARCVVRARTISAIQALSVDLEDGAQAVRRGLVRPEDAEVRRGCGRITSRRKAPSTRVASATSAPGRRDVDRVVAEVGQVEVAEQLAAVGVRVGAHAPRGLRAARAASSGASGAAARRRAPRAGSCASTSRGWRGGPAFVADLAHRHLVGAPGALDRLAVDGLGAGPALGRAQDDHRPARAARCRRPRGPPAGCAPDLVDARRRASAASCWCTSAGSSPSTK